MKTLLSTRDNGALTLLRIALGTVMFAHGAQKLLGWFGGNGFDGTMGFFTQQMGIPAAFAFLAIVAEFFGALGLIFGFLTRIAAFGIGTVLAVAMLKVHLPNGFFMNWMGAQQGEGIEFFLLAIPMAATLIWKGAGAFSVDGWLARRRSSEWSGSTAPANS
ncbi:MAG: DoxX family protein [Fimbriimonadaceae bacterium]|nr:DoxX family protein [Chthonomonadaceae bacterium]MCO5296794.1 DoxX family protein [Fimbriimonadaceae bacterium]